MENFVMTRGDTLAFGVELEGVAAQEIDAVYFSVKADRNDTNYVFQKTLGNGVEIVDENHLSIRTSPLDTATLEPNNYYYDLQIDIGNDTYTILAGKLTIKKGITEE